ncbi:hypothetical protein HWC53_gp236 [Bacillus phage vB_BmeM-Goe8]|uniref:Uncharacterized protein n=1 Tax=Bacillus phage vB_BmeM-Goe8 TaxID=2593638 RepID=A0A516KMN7_9CAUD|nr:hypothetical protein HWC53_gp236 [Bacillus phage vB_BmeM-Goe8]QDP42853.1 hypothetical protein Goe8_c00800 [Bacillus phage vB_BmeM-Goe8]
MAEKNKKDVEVSEKKEQEQKEVEAPKPYIHVDTFLQTAIPLFGLTKVQAAGFKAMMQGRQYQTDEQVFVDELKKHFKID